MSSVQALVPLKDLVRAKTRLSGILSPAERRALAQAMAEDVLTTLAEHSAFDQVTLVSDDPGAKLLGRRYGCATLTEASLGVSGLNAVIAKGCEHLRSNGAQSLVVLHADIPLLSGADLDAALAALAAGSDLVVGSDRHGHGTNLLAFQAQRTPEFVFGRDSCARHISHAALAGRSTVRLARPGIGLDVDEPADLARLLAQLPQPQAPNSALLLCQSTLGVRIGTQLASLDSTGHTMKNNGIQV